MVASQFDTLIAALNKRRAELLDDVRQIDVALQRAKTGAYGICAECGVAIPLARLQAKPDASTCVGCQTQIEQRLAR